MALNQLGLGFLFTAKDLASGTFGKLNRNFAGMAGTTKAQAASMNRAMGGITAGLGVMTLGLVGVGVGFAAANQFGKFEQSLAAVEAVSGGGAAALRTYERAAINAGIATQFSPDEATKGLLSLATAGQTMEQSTKSLIPVLDLAAGSLGQLDVASSAEAVVGTLNAYGKSASEAGAVTDKLLKITTLTNFQTRDFSAGLSKAAASGATFGQNLDDTLITMGLLRNRNLDASSSATAFREATRRLGSDQRSQQAVTKQGIKLFRESDGKMRSIIDITTDFAEKTKDLGDEERNRAVVTAFGARGLLAFNAIQKASATTMVKGKEVVLKGAAAIEFFRQKLSDSKGTAQAFKEKLLDTFEGQKTLLKGSLQTLAIVSGKAFAQAFKPIISALITGLNLLIKVIDIVPGPVKKLVGGLFLATSAFFAVTGLTIALVGAGFLLLPVLKAVVLALGIIAIAATPVIAAFGALGFFIFGLQRAADNGTTSIESFAKSWDKVKIVVGAVSQFLSEGQISGDIAADLRKAENVGLIPFIETVTGFARQMENLLSGVGKGFDKGLKQAQPAIDAFEKSFGELSTAVSDAFDGGDLSTSKARFQAFGDTGVSVGLILGKVFGFITKGMTLLVQLGTFGVKAFGLVRLAIKPLTTELGKLGKDLGAITSNLSPDGDSINGWKLFGQVVGVTVKVVVGALQLLVGVFRIVFAVVGGIVGSLGAIFGMVGGIIRGAVKIVSSVMKGDWKGAWEGVVDVASAAMLGVVKVVLSIVGVITKIIDTVFGSNLTKSITSATKTASKILGPEIKLGTTSSTSGTGTPKDAIDALGAAFGKVKPAELTAEEKAKSGPSKFDFESFIKQGQASSIVTAAETKQAAEAPVTPDSGVATERLAAVLAQQKQIPLQAKIEITMPDGSVESKETSFAPGGSPG